MNTLLFIIHLLIAAYGTARAVEAAAITRLVALGYPFQYGQELPFGKLRQAFWAANVVVRLALAKACQKLGLPQLFHPQIFMQIQNPDLAYSQIQRNADRTTTVLRVLALLALEVAISLAKRAGLVLSHGLFC
ncbi:hypothetical protein T492DRAFT_269017 [Pavlovales sp. CCMP2436]|nr:hypothetical protein T492DRAFT_269017 [Pavlovales sp. CCMP2436]